ncbi:MAG TPA: HipA domain-containing protein [Arachnia sp.]|nr:HipA domain-containing protein [Arachnia sp.]
MAEALETFWNGRHVGVFVREGGRVRFRYDEDAPDTPISLSLPRDGSGPKRAAETFLDNLLPDNQRVRARWAFDTGVAEAPFDLLGRFGEDVAGALSLLPKGHMPARDTSVIAFASDDEIASRIASIHRDPDAWLSADQLGRARMSLAGAQGKFSLAQIGDRWAWSNVAVPSTHIFKPEHPWLTGSIEFEHGGQVLASQIGVAAAESTTISFRGQRAYASKRFDRGQSSIGVWRLHMEDMVQALGWPPSRKYEVAALQVIRLLKNRVSPDAPYDFLRQLAFNVAIGNADGHGKNYSVMLDDVPRMAPLYDAVPTYVWPQLDRKLAMSIGGAKYAQEVQEAHWVKLARQTGLDEHRAMAEVASVYDGVREQAHDVFRQAGVEAGSSGLRRIDEIVAATTSKVRSSRPQTVIVEESRNQPSPA